VFADRIQFFKLHKNPGNMTSARQKKKMAIQDKQDNKRFIIYVLGIVIVVLILMYLLFAYS